MENVVLDFRARTMPLVNTLNLKENILCLPADCTILMRNTHPFSTSVEIQINLLDLVKLRRNPSKLPHDLFLRCTWLIL